MFKKLGLVALAAFATLSLAAVAGAGHVTSDVKSYTGCLVPKDGVIIKVKEGNSPAGPCTAGMQQVHLSGGDITKISVTGALEGGGDNGEVTIGLKPEFTLPSGCSNGQVAKWNGSAWACAADNDTTYAASTGLVLTPAGPQDPDHAFSIHPDYRVKNTPDCSTGQFATGFEDNGTIKCAAAAATLQAFSGPQPNFDTGAGIPDDGAFHVMAAVNVPAGNYFVTAKGQITSEGNVDDFSATECRIQSGASVYDSLRWGSVTIDDNPLTTLALAGLGNHAGGPIALACAADSGADGVGLRQGRLVVVKVG